MILTQKEVATQLCLNTSSLPHVTGGIHYDSAYNVFDEDTNGNFIIGASTIDSSVINIANPNLLIAFVLYLSADMTEQWSNYFNYYTNRVDSIVFNSDGSLIAAALEVYDYQ